MFFKMPIAEYCLNIPNPIFQNISAEEVLLSCKLIGAFYFCNFLIAEMIAALHFLQSYGMIILYNFRGVRLWKTSSRRLRSRLK